MPCLREEGKEKRIPGRLSLSSRTLRQTKHFSWCCNGLCRNWGEAHVTVSPSNTKNKTVVQIPKGAGEEQHRRCHARNGDPEHAVVMTLQQPTCKRFIKVNKAAEEWVVKAFAWQERTWTGKEMVKKKGAREKCERIQFEIINQKNNHCSNVKNMLQIRLFCVSVRICKEEYWLPVI